MVYTNIWWRFCVLNGRAEATEKKERNKNKKKVGISENQLNIIMDYSKEMEIK